MYYNLLQHFFLDDSDIFCMEIQACNLQEACSIFDDWDDVEIEIVKPYCAKVTMTNRWKDIYFYWIVDKDMDWTYYNTKAEA